MKDPSFTSIESLIGQPPASSTNLSSKITSWPSQAAARKACAPVNTSAKPSNSTDLRIEAPLSDLPCGVSPKTLNALARPRQPAALPLFVRDQCVIDACLAERPSPSRAREIVAWP